MTITKKTTLSEVVKKNPDAAELLFDIGMHCVGCPMSMGETVEQGCQAHGMTDKQIDEIVKKLNATKKGKK